MTLRILTVVGARPQFIKAAAVTRALAERGAVTEIMVHTGQHFDANMSQIFFDELEIPPPTYALGIHGGNHGVMTARMLEELEKVMLEEAPSAVLIYGDTNSTLAGALAAAKLQIPVMHVEAGLRSFDRRMPEEVNRVVADHLSALLFCPTGEAVKNLAAEGIKNGVHRVGDVMYDATIRMSKWASSRSKILSELHLMPGQFDLATIHRAENTASIGALSAIVDYLADAARKCPIVIPLHPRTRDAALKFGVDLSQLRVIDPVGYLDMTALLSGCGRVLTDSGGLQKEAYFHRKPCVTLRDTTEWVETIEAGWNRLWTTEDYAAPRRDILDYGDGHAAEKIAKIVEVEL